ncbi:hypothetical protein [Mesorhizobium sp. M1112]|uniref:hypothetical protein n=1 Tax=Mesorhizobium sp. M1112 TaxID=2957057 RepID=UPI00333D5F63
MAGGGNAHFIRSTQARTGDVLAVAETPLWRDCETTFARIDELCGENASRLLPEPIVKERKGCARLVVVAWYGSFDQEPKRFDEGMRSRVESNLAERIAALRPAQADQEIGETVRAMFKVADENSIFAVGQDPALTNWGMLPEEASSSCAGFARHSEKTIDRYLPSGISPGVPGQVWAVVGGFKMAGQTPPRRVAPEAASLSLGMEVAASSRPRRSWLWPLGALSLVFAACLVYVAWLWPTHLLYPEVLPPQPMAPVVDSAEVNRLVEEQIGRMKAELAKAACDADPAVFGPPLQEAGKKADSDASVPPQ